MGIRASGRVVAATVVIAALCAATAVAPASSGGRQPDRIDLKVVLKTVVYDPGQGPGPGSLEFIGRLRAPNAQSPAKARRCLRKRRVTVFKKRPGDDNRYLVARTGVGADAERWQQRKFTNGRDGTFYARVAKLERDGVVCLPDRSRSLTLDF